MIIAYVDDDSTVARIVYSSKLSVISLSSSLGAAFLLRKCSYVISKATLDFLVIFTTRKSLIRFELDPGFTKKKSIVCNDETRLCIPARRQKNVSWSRA